MMASAFGVGDEAIGKANASLRQLLIVSVVVEEEEEEEVDASGAEEQVIGKMSAMPLGLLMGGLSNKREKEFCSF